MTMWMFAGLGPGVNEASFQSDVKDLIPPCCSVFRGHICTKLFPPVPGPKSDIREVLATVNYEVMSKVL